MRRNLKKYGQTLQLVGGNLVYISNMVHPTYIDGIISDYDQYCIDLKNAISVGQCSVQSLETIVPPYLLDGEHGLLIKSFKEILDCLNNLLWRIDNETLTELNEDDIQNAISKLKDIEQELNVATLSLFKKIK
ncbi:hypothetical protein NGI46_25350 [Peribacillus butanolivorans]|uniref:hypothetical protein n=1 Tax=Peribacillus butanolivorans TaxID=421767 RepID=UPI00207D400B|nr:hypothetical protein [Peribacillus butanolivorans]MCO0600659.1 hypothetical protein [Peribacillus butanolivorans]